MRRLAIIGVVALTLLAAGCATEPAPGSPNEPACHFNTETLTFEVGDAKAQARCLLRHVNKKGELSPEAALPPMLDVLVGTPNVPSVAKLRAYILAHPWPGDQAKAWSEVAANLDKPVTHAWDNKPDAPQARYFVIHDTSEPFFADAPFPPDVNSDPAVNDFGIYFQKGKDPVAHFFVNRRGEIAQGHDFAVPWRATKREHSADKRFKGLFLHIEMVQPRRHQHGGEQNDYIAPRPGFTDAQYDSLALLYIVASTRAHVWVTPGFHSDVDAAIASKHDDPQHFDIRRLDAAIRRNLSAVERTPS